MRQTLLGEDLYGEDMLGDDMLGEDLLGEDLLGIDLLGEDLLGLDMSMLKRAGAAAGTGGLSELIRRIKMKKIRKALAMQQRMQHGGLSVRSSPPLLNRVPGVGVPSQVKIPLGFPVITFINGGATLLQTQAQPQVPVRGGRLIIVRQNVGAASPGLNVRLTNLLVGQQSVFASADGIAVETLGPLAVDTVLSLPAAQPGVLVTAQFSISAAPAAAETVTLNMAAMCDSIAG